MRDERMKMEKTLNLLVLVVLIVLMGVGAGLVISKLLLGWGW